MPRFVTAAVPPAISTPPDERSAGTAQQLDLVERGRSAAGRSRSAAAERRGPTRRGGLRARGVPPVLGRALDERLARSPSRSSPATCAALRVLELGCGLALPSLAAALAGADVLATDWSPTRSPLEENTRRNGVRLKTAIVALGRRRRPGRARAVGPRPRCRRPLRAAKRRRAARASAAARQRGPSRRPWPPTRQDLLRAGSRGLARRAARDRLRAHRRASSRRAASPRGRAGSGRPRSRRSRSCRSSSCRRSSRRGSAPARPTPRRDASRRAPQLPRAPRLPRPAPAACRRRAASSRAACLRATRRSRSASRRAAGPCRRRRAPARGSARTSSACATTTGRRRGRTPSR